MWWLDPGKDVLQILFNRILAPYVENLDLNQVNYGIGQGQLTLRNLRLKKEALDKFQLPVDVAEGRLGKFTLSLHWMNLGNRPVEIQIEDVFLLVIPSPLTNLDSAEEEARMQAAKLERLENAELLQTRGEAVTSSDEMKSQGLWQSLITKVINNIQITIKNIHIRYEDNISVPGHPFAAGLTLAEFTAVSVNDQWKQAFIESTAGSIHKLATLSSLALYFDTDATRVTELTPAESAQILSTMIVRGMGGKVDHQFILKPVSGEGRITINHKVDPNMPRYDVQLLFDEIGFALDEDQYRDVISLADMYHIYLRRRQYRRYRCSEDEYARNPAQERLRFAMTAVLEGIREKRRKWSWPYFAERRDDRNNYVSLFQRKLIGSLEENALEIFEALERKLSYEDLRFYRSIARSRLRKDEALRKRLETEREERESKQTTWASWFWGPTTPSAPSDATFRTPITNEQRKQLYEVLDYDEKTALADSLQAPQDSLKALVSTQLRRGSVSLISDPHGKASEIMSVIFDFFQAKFTQRPDNFEVSMLLGSLSVYDGTKGDSLYPQIVRVKSNASHEMEASLSTLSQNDAGADPRAFFYLNYENNPLDKRADNALTVRLRHMEIIYHKGYVEAIYKFFEPPASQLESVEALLDVASQTLEGIRKETRAVLEYSLQAHKTIDVQMDLNAPLIIIPEDVTTYSCKHLIIDAGHIAVESKLADKNEIRAIEQKRQQVYSEDDYKNLESLMYDRFMLRLEAAQFVIGDNLQSCRDALASGSADTLHILERTNIDLQVQISIVPNVSNLARFKISGILPHLRINFSDSKYKAMMRIVDVCIPKFDGEVRRDASEVPNYTGAFPAPSIFRHPDLEYHSDDGVGDEQNMARDAKAMNKWPDLRQTVVEIDFCADTLSAALAKTDSSALEVPLGDVTLKQFALKFSATRYDMKADLKLRSLCMTLFQPGRNAIDFVSSPESDTTSDANLLHVKYTRIEKKSPDFLTISGGFEQEVDVRLSTFIFQASPEPLIAVYDLIMSAFVSREMQTVASKDTGDHEAKGLASVEEVSSGRIRVKVNLASVQLSFIDGSSSLATLSLSTANISVILEADAMQVSGRLGNLKVTNDDRSVNLRPEFQEILSIEGQDFADFSYEKNDSTSDPQQAVESYMTLNAASIRLNFVERPLHGLYVFFLRFAKLKGLYDAATQVAVQKAPAMERMKFEVCIKSPIIVFPSDPVRSPDILVLLLGEVGASNTIEDATNNIKASLSGIQLVSETRSDSDISTLKIVDKIDISSSIVQFGLANDGDDAERPDTKVTVKISDVKLHLTQSQYCLLVDLAKSIPRIFSYAVDTPVERQATRENVIVESSSVSLEPELKVAPGQRTWTTLDLVVTMNTARLHLYDAHASSERTLKEHGVARFALHDNTLRLKVLSNGSFEAQVTLQSFTMSNTGPGNSRFREIIPAATHNRNQFTVLYTASGDDNRASLAILTIETPRIIFAVDPVIALLEFFTSPFQDMTSMGQNHPDSENNASRVNGGTIEYRIDLHDASISVLENDADPESQAIELTISQVLLSQQGILALRVDSLGMSLTRMGRPSEKVKFMDDVDFTLSLDSRSSVSHQLTSVEIFSKTVIFRASYRDIALITSIFNRALESYDSSQRSGRTERDATTQSPPEQRPRTSSLVPAGRTHVTMIKEQLKCSIDGFSLILIGDLHEQPLLHLVVKPFILGGQDWSGELRATTTIASHINYWNLTNSHWEPLMDPWTLTLSISKDGASGCMNYSLISQERLDLNLTVAFIDLVVTAMKVWNKDAYFLQKARGEYAPYRICNRTGCALTVWSESSGTSETQDIRAVKVAADEAIDWRFDDWRTTREHVSSFIQHNIGLSFDGKPWGQLHHMPVNQEGEYTFLLRPQTSTQPKRLLCEIKVVDSVKLVTLRSTYKIENSTLYPLELMLVNEQGEPIHSVERLAPGDSYPIPIDIVTQCRIRLQPDQGFGYRWSQAIRWEDVIAKKNFTVACYHADSKEAPFHVQASVQTNGPGVTQRCTKVNLRLCAPLEVENLLPYNLDYRIYDRDTEQTWMSYLRKGGAMPVHSVEVGHLLLLNVVVQDTVFKPSEFTIINPGDSEYDVENRLLLQDTLGRQLRLKLNYVRHPDSGGAFKVQIYSPYIVMNKTGVPFRIRSLRSTRAGYQDAAGEHRTEYLSNPTPFLLSHLSDDGHEFVMMIGESTWSKLISLDAPSAEVEVAAPSNKRKSECIYTGLSWTEGRGKYQLTKVITLSPRFLLKNNLSEAITFREHGGMPRDNSILEPGTRTALRVFRADNEKLLTFACPGLDAQWSPPINIADIGVVHFRLRSQGTSAVRLIRTDVQLNGATIFVSISYSENQWPFKIENNTDHIIKIRQTSGSEEMHKDTDPVYAIQPMSTLQYAWDYPAAKGKKILISINGHRRAVDLHEIGDLMPFTFYDNRRPKVVALDTKADGYVQVLRITPYSPEHSKYKPRPRSNSTFSTRTESISSSTDIFEAVPEQLSPTVTYAIDFAGIGISVIDKKLVEVLYVTMGDLKFEYAFSPVAQAINISCGTLQVDNQLHDALFPVVLQPTPIPSRSSGIAPLPTIQASIIWLNDNEHGVLFVRYCSVLLQALTIEVDEDLLFSLYELTQIEGIWEHNAEDMLMDQANDLSEPPHTAAGQNVYFEILEFQPIMLSLSFMRTERVNSDKQLSDHNPLAFALNALTMTIGNVNDAPVMMNALAFKDMRLTMPELQKRVLYHYRQDILRQLYRILGSADFIGNPVGLFNTVSSGVADIFYEPFHGVVMRGNKEFGIGLAKGAASFVKKTVFGLTDSVTKFTSSVGKGLSAATFDSEYQAKRRLNQRRNRPRHAIYGVTAGGEALASSVTSAVEGILMKPIEGAETEGAVGFFKGIGKGLIGAVTKPVVGVFDLASNVSEGIRNTTTVFDNPEKDRVRMPRLIPADNVLRSYSPREALGQFWMKDLKEGAYRREHYVAHIQSPGGGNIVLLTTMRVLSFWPKRLQAIWELPFAEVQGVTVEDTGIRFAHKSGKEHDKFVHIPDKKSQTWFFGEIASVVKSFNARRRIES